MSKTKFPARRLTTDGILIALFFVLSLFSFEIAGVKVTLDALPVVLAALLYSPADGLIVGLLGAFAEQMLHFGFTATTLLWIIPPALRGLFLGFAMKGRPIGTVRYYVCCLLAGLVVTFANTGVYYVDAKLYGYYNYNLIFGVLIWRCLTGLGISLVTALAAIPIVRRRPQ